MPGYPTYYPQGYGYSGYNAQPAPQSSFVHVQSEQQAREWNVSPGTSMMFIDDNRPYIYTKSAGMSQLEPAVFKVFQVSEITAENGSNCASAPQRVDIPDYLQRADIEPILADLEDIKAKIKELTADESA